MRKILIVEDDKVLNKTLAYNLTADGYEVTSAYSFQDAVERLKNSEFDIALLVIKERNTDTDSTTQAEVGFHLTAPTVFVHGCGAGHILVSKRGKR